MRDPVRQYQIDRAVWMYQRLLRAMDLHASRAAQVWAERLNRWLRSADRADVGAYYRRIQVPAESTPCE